MSIREVRERSIVVKRGLRVFWSYCLLVGCILVIFQSFGNGLMVQASSLVLGKAITTKERFVNTKKIGARDDGDGSNYKNSYRPSGLSNIAYTWLRGLRESKIAGGTLASTNEFPFLVSIQTSGRQHYCGGSLIASNFVLTAAHCVKSGTTVSNPGTVYILPGTNDRTCSTCTRYRGKTITVHPNYDEGIVRNDIAIIELLSSIPVDGTKVKLAKVEGGSYPIDGSKYLTVSGWGYTTGTYLPAMLMKTDVLANPVSVCLLLDMIGPNQICAGGSGHDSCAGDSGGPLFRIDSSTNTFTILGIVSYGDDDCGIPSSYNNKGVYTNTTHYLSFIKSVVPSVGVITYSTVVPPITPTILNTTNNSTLNNTTTNSTVVQNTTMYGNLTGQNTTTDNTTTYGNLTVNNSTKNSSIIESYNTTISSNITSSNSTDISNSTSSANCTTLSGNFTTDNSTNCSCIYENTNASISGNLTFNSTDSMNSTSINCTLTSNITISNNSIPVPTILNNSTTNGSNSTNSTKNSTTIIDLNGSNVATPYFHYMILTLIILFISTCFNTFAVI